MTSAPDLAFPTPGHDHHPCLSEAMERAESAFAARKIRLTDLRRMVLEEIAASHNAVGAYDIQERLTKKGHRVAPISIYRALEALLTAGVVHRLECRNAYFACRAPHDGTADNIVFACVDCGTIAESEAHGIFTAIENLAREHGFAVTARIAEVKGHCANCQNRSPA